MEHCGPQECSLSALPDSAIPQSCNFAIETTLAVT
jgi:hypothetical protein